MRNLLFRCETLFTCNEAERSRLAFASVRGDKQMKILSNQRFLAVYSGMLTIVFCVTVLCGFTGGAAKRQSAVARQSFDEIDVHRKAL